MSNGLADWPVIALAPSLRIRVTADMPSLDAALSREVDRLWADERTRHPGLFNGRVFSADHIAATCIEGHWTEYRRVVAQIRAAALHDTLRVRPLAACGVLHCADGVVFGLRDQTTLYQPGLWQLVPAGSIDPGAAQADGTIDLAAMLLQELREEVGLTAGQVRLSDPLCLVEHPGSHVLDIGVPIDTTLDANAVRTAHAGAQDREYEALMIVPEPSLADTIASLGASLVPSARAFLACWQTCRSASA